MSIHRRLLLKTTAAGGALAAFAAGFSETGRKLVKGAWAGERPENAVSGNAPKPEFRIDPATGDIVLTPGQIVAYTGCIGCTTLCGVRVRVDTEKNKVLRVAGNPYTPMSTDPFLPYGTPVRESFKALSRFQERGLNGRSTACGRGNAVLENVTSPFRVTTPLKRVGPRGSGRWEPIPFDRLVSEVCGGGDLFGEGPVDGLAALRDLKTPIDPAAPDLGPKVNQVAMITGVPDGRESLVQRFLQQAYGSINYVGHGSYCGGAYRAGSGAVFGDTKQQPHAKPDIANAEFVVFIGTAPSNAGNPFKRQATLISKARTDGALRYVVVDPVLTNARAAAAGERADWIPIRPGTDGAFAMGIIRWMFENGRIDERYLSQPNGKAAEAAGEAGWCNATHLVVVQKGHPREGRLLRASDMGWVTLDEKDRYGDRDAFVVLDPATAAPVAHDAPMTAATLFHEGTVTVATEDIAVKTGLTLLREEAMRLDLRAYSDACGVPADVIAGLARELTSHGKKAAVNSHGGMMSGSGFYNAFAVVTINTLLGNLNWKGGTIVGGGRFPESGDGPRYKLSSFPGRVKPSGIPLGRNVPYEKTSEFRAKKGAGKPYPAKAPWYPTAPGLTTEWMSSGIVDGYPYPVKALLLWNANPVYGIPGAHRFAQKLADPKTVPLVVAIDPFINETSALADYIVPDTVLYETWGWTSAWGGVPTKMTTARWPVLVPRTDKLPDGQPIQLEPFLIALAKRLDLPGFGPGAIEDMEGNRHPLETAEDWHLRAGANVAWLGKQPVPDASDEDIAFSGVGRVLPALKATLKEEEWRKVAFVLARGGRYQNQTEGFEGEKATHRFAKPLQVYNEAVGTSTSSITGRRWPGTAAWMPPVFADGTPVSHVHRPEDWPFQLVSSKSVLVSAYTIGATRLRHLHPENPVGVNVEDARRLGIETGDRIRIATPGGSEPATAIVRHGVMPGVLAVEHGFGHKEFGARAHVIGDRRQPDVPEISAGVNLNDLGLADPTRSGASVWVDPVAGTAVRQGIPAKLERTAAA